MQAPIALSASATPLTWQPSEAVAELAERLRVVGDPRRLALVALLAQQERCVCEFEELLGWPQNLISHHLGALRRAKLVATRRDAQWVYYSLRPEAFESLRSPLRELLGIDELPPEALLGAATTRRC